MADPIRPVASHGPRVQPVASPIASPIASPDGPGGPLRFTEEDLKELAESRALTKADLDAMHPDDRAVAYRAMNAVESRRYHLGSNAMFSLGSISVNPEDAIVGGIGGIAALPRLRPMVKAGGELLGTGAALYGIEKAADALKLPAPVRYGLEASLGLRALGRRFGGKPAAPTPVPQLERQGLQTITPPSSPLQAQPLEALRARHQLLANTAVRSLEQEQQFQALDRLFRQGSSATGYGYAAVGKGLQPK